jgi:hypothetical protein
VGTHWRILLRLTLTVDLLLGVGVAVGCGGGDGAGDEAWTQNEVIAAAGLTPVEGLEGAWETSSGCTTFGILTTAGEVESYSSEIVATTLIARRG